jgi:hypothetical protein
MDEDVMNTIYPPNIRYTNHHNDFCDSVDNIVDSITNFFERIQWCNCISSCRESIEDGVGAVSRRLDNIGERIDRTLDEYARTPSDDLREIAESLLSDNEEEIPAIIPNSVNENYTYTNPIIPEDWSEINNRIEINDIKVKLDKERAITEIWVKYRNSKPYVSVPFENTHNPIYIQKVIDKWFVIVYNCLYARSELFSELEKYYQDSRKNRRTRNWFEKRTEWIKFSYINDEMKPCGFKRFRAIGDTDSEASEGN